MFTTIEAIDLSRSLLVQHNKTDVEPFQRDILYSSLYESCKHRKRPARDAAELTRTVVAQVLRKKYGTIVTRDQLCTIATGVLRRFDRAAATSYAAFHPVSGK